MNDVPSAIPIGLCQCGCGQPTRRAPYTSARAGWVKGEWTRFVLGHNLKTTPRYAIDPASGCWNTLGGKTSQGYGKITHERRTILLHRWMYEVHVGPIPPGMEVHHACRNRGCCNPAHLAVMPREHHRRTQHARRPNARSPRRRLSAMDVRDVRLLGSLGVPTKRIAEHVGVTVRYVREILRGEARPEG